MNHVASQPESISQKADRLKKSYRVILTGGSEALVIGDHDTYRVSRLLGDRWRCTCPWGRYRGHWKECSHVVAVKRARKDPSSQAPVIRLAGILATAQTVAEQGGC